MVGIFSQLNENMCTFLLHFLLAYHIERSHNQNSIMNLSSFHPFRFILFFSALVLGGFLYYMVGSPSNEGMTNATSVKVEVPHTFTSEVTRLVHHGQDGETEIDPRLNKYDISNAVIPAMVCRDLQLESEIVLTIGDMKIPITAYDPKKKIGYIWLDYPLFGEGIINKSLTKYKTQGQAEQIFLNKVEEGIELFMDDEEKFLLDIFGEDPSKKEEEEEELVTVEERFINGTSFDLSKFTAETKADFEKYIKNENVRVPSFRIERSINVTRNKWRFFREAYDDIDMLYNFGQEIKSGLSKMHKYEERREYLELMFSGFKRKIYLNTLSAKPQKNSMDDWIFSAAEQIEDPIRFFGFVERIKYLGYPVLPNSLSKAIDDEVFKIILTTDTKKWWEHSNALIGLLQANKIPVINSKAEYDELLADIITNYPYKKWEDHYERINDLSNKYTISKSELEALPGFSVSHGICIAPISILDDRVIYDMKEKEYQDKLAQLRKDIANSKDKKQRKAFQDELMEASLYRSKHYAKIRANAKAKSMNVIIEEMELFLDWAEEVSKKWKHDLEAQS